MRKTSQDGGDSTSITSGLDIEFKKSGILKSKRNSVKKKAQILRNNSLNNDDGVIEPLIQKDKEKIGIENQSAKYLSSKTKTDSTRDKGKETEKLLADKKIDKPNISDFPGITGVSCFDNVIETTIGKSNSVVPIHNHMLSNVFNSTTITKESVVPKNQILIEIDGNKQSIYNPSPLIFTTAKIHIDGNSGNMDPVNVTPIPILSTIEGYILKSQSSQEPNGSIKYKNDNNLIKCYAKPGSNIATCVSTSTPHFVESSVNKYDVDCSSQLATASNITKVLADTRSEINVRTPANCEENRTDINKNIETVNIDLSGLESNISISKKCMSNVPITDIKELSINSRNFSVSSATANTYNMTTVFPSGVTFTSTPNILVSSSISACPTFSSKAIDTELSLITLTSSDQTTAIKNVALLNNFTVSQPTSFTNKSNNANDDLSITKQNPEITTVKSNSTFTKTISPSDVATLRNVNKNSTPLTKSITSATTIPSQIKASKLSASSNTVTCPSADQTNKLFSSTNTKPSINTNYQKSSSSSSGTITATVSVIPSSQAKTMSKPVKSMSTSNAITSNKNPKYIIKKATTSSTATTPTTTSSGIKSASKANSITSSTLPTSKPLSSPSSSKESSVSRSLATNKTPVAINKVVTRTSISPVAAVSSSESSVSRIDATNKTPLAAAVNRTTISSATTVSSSESSPSSKPTTNKIPVAINTVVSNSSAAAVPSVGTNAKSSLSNEQAANKNNDSSNHGKGKA